MSLRMFHIIFVSVSSLLMLYIGRWSYMMWDYYAAQACFVKWLRALPVAWLDYLMMLPAVDADHFASREQVE